MEAETEAETTKLVSTTTVSTTALDYPLVAREIRSSGGVILATTATDGIITVEHK